MPRRAAELGRLAFVDGVPGLGNRAATEAQIGSRMADYARCGQPFGVLILDLGRCRTVDDAWGHEARRAVLGTVGRTLAAATRAEDFAGRWGAAQLIALVRVADEVDLAAAAERYRRLISDTEVGRPEGPVRVTVSIGGTVVRVTDCISTLLRRAEEHLSRARREGRDQATAAA